MEHELAGGLLAGATPLTVHVAQYQYAGEVRTRGRLSALQTRVPQQVKRANMSSGPPG